MRDKLVVLIGMGLAWTRELLLHWGIWLRGFFGTWIAETDLTGKLRGFITRMWNKFKEFMAHFTSRQRIIAAIATIGLLIIGAMLIFDSCENGKARNNQRKYEEERQRLDGEIRKLEGELDKLKAAGAANEALIKAEAELRPKVEERTRVIVREVARRSNELEADRTNIVIVDGSGAEPPAAGNLCKRAESLKIARCLPH